MSELKNLNEVLSPDRRQKHFVTANMRTGAIASAGVDNLHRTISEIEITGSAPPDVHHQYDLARNLFLYSWFVYEFGTVALVQLSLTLELALKLAFVARGKELPKRNGLKSLLAESVELGWIHDDPILFDAIVGFRNSLAHGELTILPPSAVTPFFRQTSQVVTELFGFDRMPH